MSKNLIFFFIFLLCINSCSLLKIKKSSLKESNTSTENTNIIFLNFKNAIENITLEMSNDKNIFFSKKISLYVNMLRNESNIFLENKKLTNVIKNQILKKINVFNIINTNQINQSKKELGISKDNNFLNASIAMLLARNNNATYYLDSSVVVDNKSLKLKIKLILVKTGEIIFYKTKNLCFL
ncbi:hypothetical protein D9V60_01810 [Buchnera aphidicola (Aphis craccivora)]|uniref:hypothetical protein n=1 Tax=Buchnera aphidicola TaxID=9 RepID=UPI0010C53339|nr:hypothetical protein [Buchnera aphidicola]QCI16600.1 hypothetical protein D9V60_01810 [Buchnera aphidicola (Aphis craccivora)]QLL40734.1 hypothetical protein F3C69_01810 [Buchnera aphidicola (Aphis craccivore)]